VGSAVSPTTDIRVVGRYHEAETEPETERTKRPPIPVERVLAQLVPNRMPRHRAAVPHTAVDKSMVVADKLMVAVDKHMVVVDKHTGAVVAITSNL
jgi:hypothetical protein